MQDIEQVCDDPAIRALYYYKVAGCLPEELQAYVAEQGYGEILPMNPQALKALQKTDVTLLEDGTLMLQNYFTIDGAPAVSYKWFRRVD